MKNNDIPIFKIIIFKKSDNMRFCAMRIRQGRNLIDIGNCTERSFNPETCLFSKKEITSALKRVKTMFSYSDNFSISIEVV